MHHVTWVCLHPVPPQSRSCHPQSPSASASETSPAVAPLWTLNDLWYQVDFSFQWWQWNKPEEVRELKLNLWSLTWLLQQPAKFALHTWLLQLQLLSPGSEILIINYMQKQANLSSYAHDIFPQDSHNLKQTHLVWQLMFKSSLVWYKCMGNRLHSHTGILLKNATISLNQKWLWQQQLYSHVHKLRLLPNVHLLLSNQVEPVNHQWVHQYVSFSLWKITTQTCFSYLLSLTLGNSSDRNIEIQFCVILVSNAATEVNGKAVK